MLRGEISLVGPWLVTRAWLNLGHALFGDRSAHPSVRPGLVGPDKACGRAALDVVERIALEVGYARHPPLRVDLAILARRLGLLRPVPARPAASRG